MFSIVLVTKCVLLFVFPRHVQQSSHTTGCPKFNSVLTLDLDIASDPTGQGLRNPTLPPCQMPIQSTGCHLGFQLAINGRVL